MERRYAFSRAVAATKPHVLALTETWFTPEFLDSELMLTGYIAYRRERASKNGVSKHGGVLIAISKDIKHEHLIISECSDVEYVACRLFTAKQNYILVNVYNAPSSSPYRWTLDHWKKLLEGIQALRMDNEVLIIVGDANLSTVCWNTLNSNDDHENDILVEFDRRSLTQLVDFKTTATSCIDIVLCSSDSCIASVSPFHVFNNLYSVKSQNCSDHIPIKVTLIGKELESTHGPNHKYSFALADYGKLNCLIANNPFTGNCRSNINVLLEEWYKWLDHLLKQCVPYKTQHRSSLPPWISSSTSHLMKQLKTISRKYDRKPTESMLCKLKTIESQIKIAGASDQSAYEEKLAEGRSTKRLFKYFKSLRGSGSIPPKLFWGSKSAESLSDQCCMFNEFFQSTFTSSTPETPGSQSTVVSTFLNGYEVSSAAVGKVMISLDVTKSRGPDLLPPVLFKNTPTLSKSLHQLFFKIQQVGCYPAKWKEGAVSPIHKKGSKLHVENYRPITLLSIASKIHEKLIFNALYPHVIPHINSSQFGFTKNRSPVLQMLCYLDNVYRNISNTDVKIEAVYLDFAKAFDKLNHTELLRKQKILGIQGKLLKVLRSYLDQRKQFVQIGDARSELLDVTSGVPQGSLLGPLLFIIYVADLPLNLVSETFMFADDTKILSRS